MSRSKTSTAASASASSDPPPPSTTTTMDEDALVREEEDARLANDQAEEKRRQDILKKRKNKRKPVVDREAKARELDELLKKSAAFSDILTKKTQVLGRVGSSLDGKSLGEHNLQMAKQPKCMVGGTMRDYQLEGLTWMYEICSQGMSGILADEMGLGKTIQTISLIALLREQEDYLGPHLIVAPLSTLSNWMDEFNKWVPSIPVVMFHGTPSDREEIFRTKLQKNLQNNRPTKKFPVVCTSYEMVLREQASLSKINWEFIIIDEGHRMKNADAKLFQHLRQFSSATRLLITGTPLQNNLKELWSLLHFLLPTIFTDWEAFESWFDFSDLEDEKGTEEFIGDQVKHDLVKKIHLILQPLLLRRIKQDVAAYLPRKREYVLFAPMTKEQTDLYNVITNKNIDTRSYLENKAVEQITSSASNAASTKSSRESSIVSDSPVATSTRSGSSKLKQEISLTIRETGVPQKTKTGKKTETTTAPTNAFTAMMTRGRPKKTDPPAPISTVSKSKTTSTTSKPSGTKRKEHPVSSNIPEPKSSRSSRHSTPASTSTTRASRRNHRGVYKEADSDEEQMSDDEFEAKLIAEEMTSTTTASESSSSPDLLSPEEIQRAATLDLAKKQISRKKLGNPLAQLRLVCNSPHNFYNPWAVATSIPIPVDESIVTASGKMLLLDRLLPALFNNNQDHKVLIFSQFTTQIDILEDYCRELRGWPVCRIDGSVSQQDRRDQIAGFNKDPNQRIFLLSTRAGGQGINLASADTVILFDSDFNPQQDLQAQDRCHRIGQTRPVIIYRFATRGTVEESLLLSADAKRRLEKLVIKKGGLAAMSRRRGGPHTSSSNNINGDDGDDAMNAEALRALLLRDGMVYKTSGGDDILSEQDLGVLCDRSEEAYERARVGDGDTDGYKVVETGADSIKMAKS